MFYLRKVYACVGDNVRGTAPRGEGTARKRASVTGIRQWRYARNAGKRAKTRSVRRGTRAARNATLQRMLLAGAYAMCSAAMLSRQQEALRQRRAASAPPM